MRSLPLFLALAGCLAAPATLEPGAAAAEPAWTLLPPLPAERTEAAAVAAAGKIWVIGGIFPDSPATTRVDAYDPATEAWTEAPPLPLPLHHAGVVALGDAIVVTGGYVGSPAFSPVATTWVLDAASPEGGWTRGPALPEPRGAHVAASDGETIWIFGGSVTPMAFFILPGQDLVSLTRTAWRLAPGASTWEPIALFPDGRDHLAAVHHDGKVYAIGGRDLALSRNTARVDVYDPTTDSWTRGRDMPTARGGLGAAVLDGRIHVLGGEAPNGAFDTHEAYDPAARVWTTEAPMPETRHGIATASLDGALYVAAGGPQPAFTYSDTLFRYR